jgi:hypothetical protein
VCSTQCSHLRTKCVLQRNASFLLGFHVGQTLFNENRPILQIEETNAAGRRLPSKLES